MVSKWEKVKRAVGMKLCYYVPTEVVRSDDCSSLSANHSSSDAALISRSACDSAHSRLAAPSRGRLRLSKSLSKGRSSESTCSICLAMMKPGEGHAIFTAECSHSFHFLCITSNVDHGNHICPVCRARWRDIPQKSPNPTPGPAAKSRIGTHNNNMMTVIRRLPSSPSNSSRLVMPLFQETEPAVFDDDEAISPTENTPKAAEHNRTKIVDIRSYPEMSSVSKSAICKNFTVLINLKAGMTSSTHSSTARAPVDLVTVLDVSGSMAGTKLALVKRAMGFVIQNMSPNDRLSVIAFSSTARRLFPLSRMSETGRQKALLAVNSLVANGGTNIAEGLRKGAKVMEERKEKNPVASLILLSDGQDTYTVNSSQTTPNYNLLLPLSIQKIPVHTFGFGSDHDASLMHSISEISGGTFSFIETEATIQDAFAQCIGGLLSVIVQELRLKIECVSSDVRLQSIKAGSYSSCICNDGRTGEINVGDLYADEERDFLVELNIPPECLGNETSLLKVKCMVKDPLTKESLTLKGEEVKIQRPVTLTGEEVRSIEVDRQQNRLRASDAISKARAEAEQGNLSDAISILENCRNILSETISAKQKDRLCVALDAELKEMQERMGSRHVYEASGRAYVLSGLSSHSWQRATTRGDSTDSSSLIQAYQTPSMIDMVTRSQANTLMSLPRLVRPNLPFSPPKPR
ncbi:hypothetical protein RND81_08G094900 [Saponaria officinalis]|uniref:Uncharacterized protein n=1 Tax=Saponaria officinalis TaxID=3572 RepID=A0AAW1J4V2_SAPOF